jgi:uroporphyrinogen decarboxylase
MDCRLNSRERVIRAIEFELPDRIPITNAALPAASLKYGDRLNRIFAKYPSDFGRSYPPSTYPDQAYFLGRRTYVDDWGCEWAMLRKGIMGQVKGHPLSDLKALQGYRFPKLHEPERKYSMGDGGNLFERMQWLRGFEKLMVDLITRREEIYTIRDEIVDYNLRLIRRSLEFDVDGIGFADDWGTQRGLMISPSLWREFFKPAYRKMFDEVRRVGKHIFLHSDGYIMDIIPDLIELGVDVLSEAELQVNGIDALASEFGGRICFLGNLDTQGILPFGSVDEVKRHAVHAIQALGSFDGGFIGDFEVHPDIPLRNVRAAFEAFAQYGRYPLARA